MTRRTEFTASILIASSFRRDASQRIRAAKSAYASAKPIRLCSGQANWRLHICGAFKRSGLLTRLCFVLGLAVVLVVAAPPDAGLVASPRGAVEPLVHAPEGVQSARIGGIGVVDDAVLERERAHARPLAYVRVHIGSAHGGELTGPVGRRARRYLGDRFLALIIVFDALALLLLCERGAEVGVEFAVGRGRPGKRPTHSPLICLQLRERRPRDRPEHHVVSGQMSGDAVEPVRDRRAGWTPRLVVGPEHEVIDEELRAFSEEISEGRFSFVGLEAVVLVDSNPGQLLPPPRQLIAAPRQFLLSLEQLQPGRKPLFTCSGLMVSHRFLSFHSVGHRLSLS